MSLTKSTVLGIAAAIVAGFAIYSYLEPTTKAEQKKAGLQRKPNTERKKHQKKGSEESPKKHNNKKHGQGRKNPQTA